MPLRTPNTPQPDITIMQVLKNLLPVDPVTLQPNTQIGLNLAAVQAVNASAQLIYIQNKYAMSTGTFPAVHLSAGQQVYNRNSNRTMMGKLQVLVEYYDRWDTQPNTIDAIRASIAADLERMKSNVESNDSLAYGGQSYVISIPQITLSPYKGEFDQQFPGLTLIHRDMTLTLNILPYDV